MTDLLEIVQYVKSTALMGLPTVKGAFSEAVIRRMASQTPRPIVFPLSNPLQLSECTFSEALRASRGSVLFASGHRSPQRTLVGEGGSLAREITCTSSRVRRRRRCVHSSHA
jgi:malate dehydrogenase (oxaloacetate-decarboxylating)(NADP+)